MLLPVALAVATLVPPSLHLLSKVYFPELLKGLCDFNLAELI
jgi:hypothetical protein